MAVVAPLHQDGSPDRLPPQSLDAEVSVLGAILITEPVFDQIEIDVGLRPEHFYFPKHSAIFKAMLGLKDKAQPVDALTVIAELERSGELDEVGGAAYVHSLPTLVPSAAHARQYAQIVRDRAQLRRLLGALREAQEQVYTFPGSATELMDQTEAQIYKVAHAEATSDLTSLEEVLDAEIDRLHELSEKGVSLTGTPSGFTDLDAITGGFQPGNLVILAARPAMGKSALALNIAHNAAMGQGMEGRGAVPVAVFSLEMSQIEIVHRLLGAEAKLSADALRKGQVKTQWGRVLKASEKLARAQLWIDDSSDLGIHELRAKVRRLKGRMPDLGLVIVDYLQLMRADDPRENRVQQIGAISRGLKLLAGELGIPVVALSQLSRQLEQRPRNQRRPMLSDLRESGNIEQDADVVMFIYRDEVYDREGEMEEGDGIGANEGAAELIIGKHRNGPIGTVHLHWQAQFARFLNREPEYTIAVPSATSHAPASPPQQAADIPEAPDVPPAPDDEWE